MKIARKLTMKMKTTNWILLLCFIDHCFYVETIKLNATKTTFNIKVLAAKCSRFISEFGHHFMGSKSHFHFFVPRPNEDDKMTDVIAYVVREVSRHWIVQTQHTSACQSAESWVLFPANKSIRIHYHADVYVIPVLDTGRGTACRDAQLASMYMQEGFNPRAAFVLVRFTAGGGDRTPDGPQAVSTFNALWAQNVLKVLLLQLSESQLALSVVTGDPFSDRNRCRSVELGGLNILHTGCGNDIDCNKRSLKDFRGCVFKAGTHHLPPYVVRERVAVKGKLFYKYVGGIDIELMKLFSTRANLTLQHHELDGLPTYPNNTTSLFYDLLQHNIDVAFAGIIPLRRGYYKVEYSTSYMYSAVSGYVADARYLPQWSIFIISFPIETWILSVFVFLIVSLQYGMFNRCNFILKLGQRFEGIPYGQLFRLHLGFSSTLGPKSCSLRVLLFSWAMYSVNITIVYTTVLFTLMARMPRERDIVTLQDLRDSGLRSNVSPQLLEIFANKTIDQTTRSILDNHKKCPDFGQCMRELIHNRDVAIIDKRENVEFMVNLKKAGLHRLFDDVLTYSVSIVTNRGNPLTKELNSLLMSSLEAGLVLKWKEDVNWNYRFLKQPASHEEQAGYILNLLDLKGAFVILSFGNVIALAVLFGEIILNSSFRCEINCFVHTALQR